MQLSLARKSCSIVNDKSTRNKQTGALVLGQSSKYWERKAEMQARDPHSDCSSLGQAFAFNERICYLFG